MTILPKKKNSKDKNESETTDHNHGSHSHNLQISHTSANETRDRSTRTRNSPPRWTLPTSRDEKRPAHPSSAAYDDYDGLESGPSHSKRRHRASPLRLNRKHRINNHSNGNNSSCSSNSGSSSCSTSGSATCSNSGSNAGVGEDFSGYNSGDEYGPNVMSTENEIEEAETIFENTLKEKKGLTIKKMGEDGACLFRAVADQVYGDQEMHATVRNHCMDYMAKNSDYYSQYVTEDFETYIQRKRMDHIHGNHIEMQAMSEMYNRTIEVYQYSPEPINIFHGMHKTDNEPIRVSYHRNVHYNSVVDPYKATVGVGLGMPSFKPGVSASAEKKLMSDAIRQSEEFHIEQAMLEDKLRATDWEATNEAIEEQIARESYLQWLRDNEKRNRKTTSPRMPSATCSSATATSESGNSWWDNSNSPELRGWRSPRSGRSNNNSAANSPSRPSANEDLINLNMEQNILTATEVGSSNYDLTQGACASLDPDQQTSPNGYSLLETASLMNQLPPSVFGLTEWEDEAILAQVLAASQQEYLDSLKRNNSNSKEFSSDCS